MQGLVNGAAYAASKAAVIGSSRTLARELGRYSIRVNSVAPLAFMTEGTSEFMGDRLDRAKEAIAAGQTIMVNGGTHFL